ncbi:hypothetical protein DFH08DRAFT_825637 [Mycena albidolilacea]|uniref:Uncharacterized protein n=1 Tax=Mycena albidolilacea TaxID=1033008 RepID=A0AAD6Z2H0_9AGAR|nr:hypothetical protein DFH08DRAFT_825637 [Mycena albidolilacea]
MFEETLKEGVYKQKHDSSKLGSGRSLAQWRKTKASSPEKVFQGQFTKVTRKQEQDQRQQGAIAQLGEHQELDEDDWEDLEGQIEDAHKANFHHEAVAVPKQANPSSGEASQVFEDAFEHVQMGEHYSCWIWLA